MITRHRFLSSVSKIAAANVANLIKKHGRRGNMTKWVSDLKGDCPRATYRPCMNGAT